MNNKKNAGTKPVKALDELVNNNMELASLLIEKSSFTIFHTTIEKTIKLKKILAILFRRFAKITIPSAKFAHAVIASVICTGDIID